MTTFLFGDEARPAIVPRSRTILIGRVLLGSIFLLSGIEKLMNWSGTAAFMESEGLVAVPLLLALAMTAEIVGSLSLLTGTFARAGALVLLLFLIPTTLIMHDFWVFEGAERQVQMVNFLKNLSIMGGLLLVIGAGAGRVSVDDKIEKQM